MLTVPKLHPRPRAEELINYLQSYGSTDIEKECLRIILELSEEASKVKKLERQIDNMQVMLDSFHH